MLQTAHLAEAFAPSAALNSLAADARMGAHLSALFCRSASGEAGHHGIAAEPQPAGEPCRPRGAAACPAPHPLRPAAVTGGACPQSLRGARGAWASSPEG